MAEEGKNKTSNILEGDQDNGIPSWLVPILSGLGSMGGSYMLWVKPLQDNFKAMAEQIEDLKDDIAEIKQKQKQVDRDFYSKLEHALKGLEGETSNRFNASKKEEEEDEIIFLNKKEKYVKPTKKKTSILR